MIRFYFFPTPLLFTMIPKTAGRINRATTKTVIFFISFTIYLSIIRILL